MDARTIESVSQKTGLKVSTCADLLNCGWRYIEELDKPARWVSPLSSLQRRRLKNVNPTSLKENP